MQIVITRPTNKCLGQILLGSVSRRVQRNDDTISVRRGARWTTLRCSVVLPFILVAIRKVYIKLMMQAS